jgi:hypothetical protein
MHGHALTDKVICTDAKEALAIAEADILGFAAEDCAFVDGVYRTERSKSLNNRVCANIGAISNLRVLLDNSVGAYGYAGSEPGPGADYGSRVNVHWGVNINM